MLLASAAAPAAADVALTRVSADPFTNATSQHATEVEPDTFASGSTVVATYQVGRFFNGGASRHRLRALDRRRRHVGRLELPARADVQRRRVRATRIARSSGSAIPSVAYDAQPRHVADLLDPALPEPVRADGLRQPLDRRRRRRSATPVQIPPPAVKKVDLDKNWTVCDNHRRSPFYGNCYTEFDNFGEGDLEYMSTSLGRRPDLEHAGRRPRATPRGSAASRSCSPNGTVIVPFESLKGTIGAFRSTDGGAIVVEGGRRSRRSSFHPNSGGLRTSPLPTAEIDAAGTVYVAWEDCRFEPKCSANDIVFSTLDRRRELERRSARIPIDAGRQRRRPLHPRAWRVDPATSGAGAHLALTYYFYPNAACTPATCQLDVGYISSPDGGAHWSAPTQLAGPMSLADIAATSQGPMVGDYISTSFNAAGTAATVFAIGNAAHRPASSTRACGRRPPRSPSRAPRRPRARPSTGGAAAGPGRRRGPARRPRRLRRPGDRARSEGAIVP